MLCRFVLLYCMAILVTACATAPEIAKDIHYAAQSPVDNQSAAAFPLEQAIQTDTTTTTTTSPSQLSSCERSFAMIMAEATKKIDARRPL